MVQDPEQAKKVLALASAIMEAVSRVPASDMGGVSIDGQTVLDAFHYIAAAMLEAHPDLSTNGEMREACEVQSKVLLTYMKAFRSVYDRTGQHAWEAMSMSPSSVH